MLKRVLGLLGWLGVALVLAAVAISQLRPEWQWYRQLAIGGLVCTLLYVLSQWREIAREFSGRQARFGTLATASVLVVLGILAAINYLAARNNKRWDLTAGAQYTLSDQTKKVLHSLDKPVRVTVFAREGESERFRNRLDQYQYESKQLQIEYIDPEKRPALAERLKDAAIGTVVLEYDGRVQRVSSDEEQDLTNALIKVVQGDQHKVYFVAGHGERDLSGSDGRGYAGVKQALGADNFTAEPIVLLQQEIPADATVLALAGPTSDLLQPEVDRLRSYLNRGGKLLVLLDPPQKVDAPPLTNVLALLKEWSVSAGNDAVLDPLSRLRGAEADVPVAAPPYPYHEITSTFRMLTAYPFARSMKAAENIGAGQQATSFIQSGPGSWAETDLKTLTTRGEAQPNLENGDTRGPVSLAVAVAAAVKDAAPPPAPAPGADAPATKPETRLVAVGDSDFAANAFLNTGGNRDMFLNIVNWLAQQENLIAVRPRDPEDRRITVGTPQQQRLIFWFSVLIMPGLILLAGVHAWWRRR